MTSLHQHLLTKSEKKKKRLVKESKIKKDKTESYIYRGVDNSHYEKTGIETHCIDDEHRLKCRRGGSFADLISFIGLAMAKNRQANRYHHILNPNTCITKAMQRY